MKNLSSLKLTILALLFTATTINAAPRHLDGTYPGDDPFSVKYMGNEGDYVLFEVVVNSGNEKNTSFKISDTAEGEIYSAKIRSPYKVQTMKIEMRDKQQLNFLLKIGDVEYSKTFAILSPVRMERI